ncbi:MAG TPA: hypothetical protein VG651_09540 [Stellaceae bacterium]|nr:hypothetical protein [Stellaceae bacterium]
MQQLTMLITADGKWVLPGSEEFLGALGDPDPDYDAIGFAVRNLGFVKFQVLDRLVTEIELHPRNVDLRALLALEKLLGEVGTNLFRIKYLEDEWRSEISASADHTLARLRELCAPVFEPPPNERFHVEPRDPDHLFSQERRVEGLGLMAMKWRVSFGNFDGQVLDIASRSDLLPLMAIVAFESGQSSPVFRFIGEGHSWAGQQFKTNAIGEKVENMPDREYGHWITDFHRSVASSGQPRLDLCTSAIEYHDKRGQRPKLIGYERLLLPWRTASGEVLITSFAKKVEPERSANFALQTPNNSVVK